jgi:hypothetical protein
MTSPVDRSANALRAGGDAGASPARSDRQAALPRMREEHVAEHAAFWELLSGTPDDIAARIDDLVEEIDAHMLAEERTFLSPVTLQDDVIRARTREHINE